MTFETLTDYSQIAAAVATTLGFTLIVVQTVRIRRAMQISASNGIYARAGELRREILVYPETRPYLFDGKTLPERADTATAVRVATLSEMMLNYLEIIDVHADSVRGREAKAWRNFVRQALKKAPVARATVLASPEAYGGTLAKLAQEAESGQ